MLKLTRHDNSDDIPDSYRFPTEAARFLRRGNQLEEAPVDRGASRAAHQVEQAMRRVQTRFDRLRDLLEFPDPNRPRAA